MLNLNAPESAVPNADLNVQVRRAVAQQAGVMRVAIVTNIPAPYRLPVYELLARTPGIELSLFFCSGREADREWDLTRITVPHVFLRERVLNWRHRFIHANPDLWVALDAFRPDVVVTTGFNPTHLLAFLFAGFRGLPHVAMTDGTAASESSLTFVHRLARRVVYRRTQAFVGASEGSFELYRQYGLSASAIFKSHLCANNAAFTDAPLAQRDFDFIFCGRFVDGKLPLFAIAVAAQTAQILKRRVRLLLVGSGVLDERMRHETDLRSADIEAHFTGFARQAELPGHYARARVLLFPTLDDTWGVVANEACAAGVPVFVSPHAGVAGDLIRDGGNGRVLPLDCALWAESAAALLSDAQAWNRMSESCREAVRPYTFENAANGLAAAVMHARNSSSCEVMQKLAPPRRRRVVLIQRRMTHYRAPLFDRMRSLLAQQGIDLEVIYGDAAPSETSKRDLGHLPWGRYVRCRYLAAERLCWQWAWPHVRGADLVITPHENKLLLNYLLVLCRAWLPMALWGHGKNFQSTSPRGLRERLKRFGLRRADWWFAYTEASAVVLQDAGYSSQKTTVVNNAIDVQALAEALQQLDGFGVTTLKQILGLQSGPVGLVLGSVHADKGLDFLLQVARLVRMELPEFQLLVVGDGPDRARLQGSSGDCDWVRWTGVLQGEDKAKCLRAASVMLNPFGIGLVVLDSFVGGVPMVVTIKAGHGPEFAYLKDGVNCVFAPAHPQAYAKAVVNLLNDESQRCQLAAAGFEAAQELTLDNMAARFCSGIVACLSQRGARSFAATA